MPPLMRWIFIPSRLSAFSNPPLPEVPTSCYSELSPAEHNYRFYLEMTLLSPTIDYVHIPASHATHNATAKCKNTRVWGTSGQMNILRQAVIPLVTIISPMHKPEDRRNYTCWKCRVNVERPTGKKTELVSGTKLHKPGDRRNYKTCWKCRVNDERPTVNCPSQETEETTRLVENVALTTKGLQEWDKTAQARRQKKLQDLLKTSR